MKKFIALIASFYLIFNAYSQDYYWVGGSGNWSDFTNHWATSSGGSVFHSQAPTSTDNVYFDANSFTATSQVVTLDLEANCLSMDWTGVINFPTIVGNGNDLNVYGSLILSPDMTADFSDVEFESSLTGNTITTNGTSLGSSSIARFNGVGGAWSLQDNFETNSLFMVAGTLTTNNNNMDTGDRFDTSGSNPKTINLGSSEITTVRWWLGGTNLTVNAGTSKIIVSSFYGDENGAGPFTYHDIEFFNYAHLRYDATFNEITVPEGLELELRSGDTFTINNLAITGTKYNPVVISATGSGSEATFSKSSGSITISYAELRDVHATGGATFTANNSIDNGNNTGWSINAPVPQDYFWVANSGEWTDFENHWVTSSGGATFHSDYPGRYDHVYFDNNSFSLANQTVTVDVDAQCADIDWTGASNAPRFTGQSTETLEIYGSATFTDEVEKTVYNVQMKGSGSHTLTYGTNEDVFNFTIDGPGTFTFLDSVFVGNFSMREGTVNLNGNPISAIFSFNLNGSETVLNAGGSDIYCQRFNFQNSSSTPVFNQGTSTVHVTDGSIGVQSLSNRSFTFHNLVLGESTDIAGAHTVENLTIEPGADISFEESTTTTVNGQLNLTGTKAAPITLNSASSGTQSTLSKGSGTVNATYLILQDIEATGGATFNATETIDNGNNSGWNISGLTGDDYYWVGNQGNWSDFNNHWATSSGGSTFHVAAPGVLDNVIFDANSFDVGGEIVTIDVDEANCNDLDASTVDQSFFLSGSGKDLNIYGSLDIPSTVSTTFANYNFLTTGTATISFNDGPGFSEDINFLSGGTWTLTSPLSADEINMENGTLNTNGVDVDVDFRFDFLGTDSKTLNLGTTVLTLGGWFADAADNVTINGGSSEIFIRSSYIIGDDPTQTITLNNLTYQFNGSGSSLVYTDITVNRFTIEAGSNLRPVGDVLITTSELVAVGTESDPIVIEPQTDVSSLTFSQSSGVVNGQYLQMQDVTATGGATFNAFNSLNNGNVIGWIFDRDPQTISFDEIPDKIYGEVFDLSASASSGLEVSFEAISGPATVDGDVVTITGVGTVQIKAEQLGDIDYDPAPSVIQSFEVNKADQIITFSSVEDYDLNVNRGSIFLDVSASSGLAIELMLEGPASLSGNEVTPSAEGSVTITASQAGNENFNAASNVVQSFQIINTEEPLGLQGTSTHVTFYPNPAQEILHIQPNAVGTFDIEIQSVDGRMIRSFSVNESAQLNLTDLPQGLYLIKVRSDQKLEDISRLIVE